MLDREIARLAPTGIAHEKPLDIANRLRRLLRVPDSSKTHWHLDPTSVEGREYAWFSDPVSLWPSRILHWGKLALAVLVLLAVVAALAGLWIRVGWSVPVVSVVAIALAVRLFWRWLQGKHEPTTPTPAALHALTEQEDKGVHNHMASLALLKPGLLRRLTIRTVLRSLNLFYRTIFTDVTPGKLAGLPTIHFAQWSIVELPNDAQGRRREALMFLSNYDGSWETYLDDFLAFLLQGVIAIWGSAETFPSPLDGRIFKYWARTRMHPFTVWHDQAYGALTVSNIQNNDRLRLGLLEPPRTDYEARLWLARLGAVKRGDEQFDDVIGPLPTDDMQGLLLRGYGALPHAEYVLLRLDPDRGDAARRWLRELLPSITDGRELDRKDLARETEAVNIAVTYKGLQILGLPAAALAQFPMTFREGIAPVDGDRSLMHRSRILGDVGDSAPDHWAWGGRRGRAHEADVLLMLYANSDDRLENLRRGVLDAFHRSRPGGEAVYAIRSERFVDPVHRKSIEHFGFVDGLSQPTIEGTWQAARGEEGRPPADLVKPGEFILGYESGDGSVTPGVPLEAAFDRDNVLPWTAGTADRRDFGRNGTFLVARQLAQDVAEFRRFTAEAGGVAPEQYATRAAETVAARLVGRWRSGTPLVDPMPGRDPNAFSFASDPHGFRCPIGAHVRRSNPRDSLGTDAEAARAAANRHRLIRRGRTYGPPLESGGAGRDAERGLMFICLNADIERQFEFVQQNWINNPAFGGLNAERDPLIGASEPPAFLTVQGDALCTQIEGLSRFVTVVGGGYFFMPGMRALRYLARLEPAALPRVAAVPEAALVAEPRQSSLRSAFGIVMTALPLIRLLWAIRFPLLVAALLVLLPLAASRSPAIALSFFLTSAPGVALIAFLASTAAWTVMVTLRLVLLYGTRIGLSRPQWTRDAKWAHVFAFQVLALPVVIGSIVYTVRDAAGAGDAADGLAMRLSFAAAAGLVLGVIALGAATAIQSLRGGPRPDLFAPPVPVVTTMVRKLSRARMVHRVSRRISSLASWIVNSVPEEIGVGYIDYRNRRLLPGHPFAAVLAALVLAVYVAGFFALNPARRIPQLDVPPAAYLLFVFIALGWVLSAAAFFLDRYRIPTSLTLLGWLIIVASIARTDHVFEVGGPVEPAATPADIAAAASIRRPGKVIVVASEGYALASAAWTAEVLTRLAAEETGRQFVDAVRLMSASSGATLAAAQFADAYTSEGFGARDAQSLEALRSRARAPASADGWWGLVYPDLIRAVAPVLVPAREDRGWALEQAWKRALPDKHGATLSAWRRDVANGWRPATAFGVTSVETGEQGLLATYRARTHNATGPDFVTVGRDVQIVTAARLAASFPYITPSARADTGDAPAYHFTDGGFWDNSGLVAALQWIEDAGPELKPVMLIEVRSAPRAVQKQPEKTPWTLEAFGPLRTLVQVRYDGDAVRTDDALRAFLSTHPVEHVVFELNDTRIPFTWNLGRAPVRYIEEAWNRGDNRAQRDKVRAFLSAQ